MTAAIVLSAGLGTRLRPLTDDLPKPLMPVGDRPMLAHILDRLRSANVVDLRINTHHRASEFSSHAQHLGPGLNVIHEPAILGTAGGVANATDGLADDELIVWNGDIL